MSLSTEKNSNRQQASGFQKDLEYLRDVKLFQGLDYECVKILAMVCKRIDYISGDQLMVQGEDDGHAYFIISGKINAWYKREGSKYLIRTIGPGQFVGCCALLGKMVRSITLETTEPTRALLLQRESFQKTMEQFPGSNRRITANLVAELADWDRHGLDTDATELVSPYFGVSLL
jgi:CRP-like cAMP-binding protein